MYTRHMTGVNKCECCGMHAYASTVYAMARLLHCVDGMFCRKQYIVCKKKRTFYHIKLDDFLITTIKKTILSSYATGYQHFFLKLTLKEHSPREIRQQQWDLNYRVNNNIVENDLSVKFDSGEIQTFDIWMRCFVKFRLPIFNTFPIWKIRALNWKPHSLYVLILTVFDGIIWKWPIWPSPKLPFSRISI